jgi:hypothetical protein
VGALSGCDLLGPDDNEPRGEGTLDISILSPSGLEGSAVLEILGGDGLGIVSTTSGQAYYSHQGDRSRAVVILDEPGVIRFQVRTEDVAVVPTVNVIQVADGNDELRTSVDGYSAVIEPLPDSNGSE